MPKTCLKPDPIQGMSFNTVNFLSDRRMDRPLGRDPGVHGEPPALRHHDGVRGSQGEASHGDHTQAVRG